MCLVLAVLTTDPTDPEPIHSRPSFTPLASGTFARKLKVKLNMSSFVDNPGFPVLIAACSITGLLVISACVMQIYKSLVSREDWDRTRQRAAASRRAASRRRGRGGRGRGTSGARRCRALRVEGASSSTADGPVSHSDVELAEQRADAALSF